MSVFLIGDWSWQVAALTVSSNDMQDFVPFQTPLLFRGGEVLERSSSGFGFSLKIYLKRVSRTHISKPEKTPVHSNGTALFLMLRDPFCHLNMSPRRDFVLFNIISVVPVPRTVASI